MTGGPRLRVRIDGELVDEAGARELWARFSAHMDAHPGDLAGFARAESMTHAEPVLEADGPVLHLSRNPGIRAPVYGPARQAADQPTPPKRSRKRPRRRKKTE